MLSITVAKQLGQFSLDVAFDTASGVTALFGPSGAGKSTIANMIAGLVKPDRGRIVLDGEVLFETDITNVPPHKRRIGYVFQEGRLFPHMTVRSNLAYGRYMHGLPHDEAAWQHIVDLLDIGHLLARRPGKLSGGERQRAAFGRALLMKPRLLVLDEPLASLDRRRKLEILPYLVRLRDDAKIPMVYVSHQAGEIIRLASQVVQIDEGRVVAVGGHELLDMRASEMMY